MKYHFNHTLIYTLLAFVLAGCTTFTEIDDDQNDQRLINLAVQNIQVDGNSKAVGVIEKVADFDDNDRIALYAVPFNPKTSQTSWANPGRAISTLDASINTTGDIIVVQKSADVIPFPDEIIAFYSLYPSQHNAGVTVTDNADTKPVFDVKLFDKPATQYDVLVAKSENVGREAFSADGTKKLNMTFKHALAQLKINVYSETGYTTTSKITKVTVNAPSKATLTNIEKTTWSTAYDPFNTHDEPIDFELYNNATGVSIPTGVASKITLEGVLMLFPGTHIKSINLTINENQFPVSIPDTYALKQGQLNMVDIIVKPLTADFMTATIKPWTVGESSETEAEVKTQTTKLKVEMKDFETLEPDFANKDFAIKARIAHKLVDGKPQPALWLLENRKAAISNMYLPATYDNTTKSISINNPAATLMLNSDDIYLTDFVIAAKPKTENRTFVAEDEIYPVSVSNVTPNLVIDKNDGAVKVDNQNVKFHPNTKMLGDGSILFPFEVTSSVNKTVFQKSEYMSSSFIVTEKLIDFTTDNYNWIPIATDKTFKGTFDGNGATIKISCTRVGMAAFIAKAEDATIQNLTISGAINSTGDNTAGIVAHMNSGDIRNCINKANITSTKGNVGGIVGTNALVGNLKDLNIFQCANHGNITITAGTSATARIGGIFGNIGSSYNKVKIDQSYNSGNIKVPNIGEVGGIAGKATSSTHTITDSYNIGNIEGTSAGEKPIGGLVGFGNSTVSISNSFNSGVITMPNNPRAGALIGRTNKHSDTFTNLYYITNDPNLYGLGYIGAVKQTSDIRTIKRKTPTATLLNNGNRTVWVQQGGLPVLSWQNNK